MFFWSGVFWWEMGEGETPEQRGIDSLKDRTKKVLCLLKIMYHLHIWKQKHRETIFKAPEKYSKRFQRAMSSASNVSTSSKDIKFPETFFVFCWRRKNFLHFVETRSKPSRMIPQQTRFIFRDTFFSYAHLTCVVFAWRGKVKVFFLNRC